MTVIRTLLTVLRIVGDQIWVGGRKSLGWWVNILGIAGDFIGHGV